MPKQLQSAPRCQARTKAGRSCRCPAVTGKRVCKTHGGLSPGAPKGEANGNWKNGRYTNEAIALRRAASELLRELRNGA
ncbi:HGGxSTG domain-containing protein [Altererythrobacter sp. Root672]|uniref:HGGxSTG domain-containing protein n=1 Tax=Altererythrobacter sp. Root672 TaxID=1736584 RepID=UPI0039E0F31C